MACVSEERRREEGKDKKPSVREGTGGIISAVRKCVICLSSSALMRPENRGLLLYLDVHLLEFSPRAHMASLDQP